MISKERLLNSLRAIAGKLVTKEFKDVPAEYMDEIDFDSIRVGYGPPSFYVWWSKF